MYRPDLLTQHFPLAPQAIFDSNDAHEEAMAEPWQSNLSSFNKLLFLRCVAQ